MLLDDFKLELLSASNGDDLTSLINNAAVTSTSGWTNGRIGSNQQYTGAPDNTYLDTWNATLDQKQTINLPAGYYLLKAATRAISSVSKGNIYAYANGGNVGSTNIHKEGNTGNLLDNGWGWTRVPFTLNAASSVTIGFYSECGSSKWAGADNFTLTYYDSELNLAAARLAEVVADAEVWKTKLGALPAGITNALDAEDNASYETVADYEAAISRIETAISNARNAVEAYALYNKYYSNVATIKAVTVTDASAQTTRQATLNAAVSSISAAVNNATDAAGINTQTAALKAAILEYIKKLTPADAENAPFDLTFMITNPSFSTNEMTGWSGTTPNFGNDATQKAALACEYYQKEFDIYQELTGMVTGNYRLKVKAYQRPGASGTIVPAYVNAEEKLDGIFGTTSEIYVNGGNEAAQKIKNAASPMITTKIGKGDESEVTVGEAKYYIPNDMVSAVGYFDAGYYENEAEITASTSTIRFGFRSTTTPATADWTIFDDFRLYYTGQLALTVFQEQLTAKVTEANGVKTNLEGKVPAGALTALQAAIDDNDNSDEAFTEEEQFTEAIDNINAAIATAQSFETPYADYNTAKTTAKAFIEASMIAADWTTLQSAITANTVDESATTITVETLTTATANLNAASDVATAAVDAKTRYDNIVTAVEGNTNVDLTSYLTNPGFNDGNTNGWVNDGSIDANAQGNTSFDNKEGTHYAERWHAAGTIDINQTLAYLPEGVYLVEAKMYSDTGDAKLYANSEHADVSTSGTYAVRVEVADKGTIKFGASCTLTASTWICMDDFKITYLCASVNDLTYTLTDGKMGTDKADAQTAAETAFNTNKTATTYNALLAAIKDAEASVANYTALQAAIDAAKAVKDANNFVTAAATSTFETAITNAEALYNTPGTDAQATETITSLGATAGSDRAGAAGQYMASAWGKTSENWTAAPYINTWSVEANTDGSNFYVPFFEYFTGNTNNLEAKTMTATLTGLAKGRYEVEIWARVQRRSDADFNADNSYITMSVNGGDAVSIMNGSKTVGTGGSTMRLDRFTAVGDVTDDDGTLTLSIDVKLGSNVHWLSWRDVKYTKLDEANMTIAAGKYGTFIAPFAVTIPEGVTASKVTGVSGNTLTLEAVETTIPANTPVVVTSETAVDETFYGKSTADDVSYTVGRLTGVYTTSDIPQGSYVLQTKNETQGFYYVNVGGYKATPNRCYLTLPTTSGVKAFFFGDTTDGIQGVEADGLQGAEIYNLAGQRVQKAQRGVYIVGGKKVAIK